MKIPFVDLSREWHFFEKEFIEAFAKFGADAHYVLGSCMEDFENNFAKANGYKFASVVSTGLAAIEVALLAYGIKEKDEVITVPNSAVATSLAISRIGAVPVFCDIRDDFLMDPGQIERLITTNTRAILPVHLFGKICDMEKINEIAEKYNLIVIEDACQAHGAAFSRVGLINTKAYSFYPTKNLGALGEGGMILTNDEKVKKFADSFRNYGQEGRYRHVVKGANYRLSALQCVFLNLKLAFLPQFVEKRREIAKKYVDELCNKNLLINEFDLSSSYHLFVIRILNEKRDILVEYLKNNGIEVLVHYPIAIYEQPCYSQDYIGLELKKTEELQEQILSLPCYPFLGEHEQNYIIKIINEFEAV